MSSDYGSSKSFSSVSEPVDCDQASGLLCAEVNARCGEGCNDIYRFSLMEFWEGDTRCWRGGVAGAGYPCSAQIDITLCCLAAAWRVSGLIRLDSGTEPKTCTAEFDEPISVSVDGSGNVHGNVTVSLSGGGSAVITFVNC